MKCIKWIVYFTGITLISLMLQACGGGGSGSGEYNYEIGTITIETVSPVLEEKIDPESGETIYVTSDEEIYIAGDIFGLTETYNEACSEVDELEPLLLTGIWNNLTTSASGNALIKWHTNYGTLFNTCIPMFNLNAGVTDGLNIIEITVTHEDGHYGKTQVLVEKQ